MEKGSKVRITDGRYKGQTARITIMMGDGAARRERESKVLPRNVRTFRGNRGKRRPRKIIYKPSMKKKRTKKVKAWAIITAHGVCAGAYVGQRNAAMNCISIPCTITYSHTK